MADLDDYLTTAQVAELAHRTVTTINRWAAEGRIIPAHKLPGDTGAYLYQRSDVDALLADTDTAA